MAQPIYCDNQDGNLADLLITQLATGDTIGLCVGCVPGWMLAALKEMGMIEDVPDLAPVETSESPAAGDDTTEERGNGAQPSPRPKRDRPTSRSAKAHPPAPSSAEEDAPDQR